VTAAIGWTLVTVSVVGLAIVSVEAIKLWRSKPLSSRGEEAGVPEERDDEMAVARAAGVEPTAVDWELLEEQCHSLEPLVKRVARVKEGRR
jgi:hypothetical protein